MAKAMVYGTYISSSKAINRYSYFTNCEIRENGGSRVLGDLLAAVGARRARRSLGPKREAGPRSASPPHRPTEELRGKWLQRNAEKVKLQGHS